MSEHSTLSPVLFIPHGGGPLPLLGDPRHQQLVEFLQALSSRIPTPSAICVISAHWEEPLATVTSGSAPSLIYDYYGFPQEAYAVQYPAPGSPVLAHQILSALQQNSIDAHLDDQRGFDHGLFVPLKLAFPEAVIPCVQLSLLKNLDPAAHIMIGEALRPLRQDNVLFIGSGLSFHNMQAFFTDDHRWDEQNAAFEEWLIETCTQPKLSFAERTARLIAWEHAPSARYCHPRAEHLLPLHLCAGLSSQAAELIFDGEVLGKKTCGFIWHL
jgi:4,5-DOPA dioxygenase extradiol